MTAQELEDMVAKYRQSHQCEELPEDIQQRMADRAAKGFTNMMLGAITRGQALTLLERGFELTHRGKICPEGFFRGRSFDDNDPPKIWVHWA